MEEDLLAQLLASTALTDLVGERITWAARPVGDPLPGVVLHLVTAPPQGLLSGPPPVTEYLLQVDCLGGTWAAARAVSRAMAACAAALAAPFTSPGYIEGVRSMYERMTAPDGSGATDVFTASLDVRVWHFAA